MYDLTSDTFLNADKLLLLWLGLFLPHYLCVIVIAFFSRGDKGQHHRRNALGHCCYSKCFIIFEKRNFIYSRINQQLCAAPLMPTHLNTFKMVVERIKKSDHYEIQVVQTTSLLHWFFEPSSSSSYILYILESDA